jgi:hypothetical protein
MRSIEYPNTVAELVVIEFRGLGRVGFGVRPVREGQYRLLLWPEGLPDPDLYAEVLLEFPSASGPPAHAVVDLSNYRASPFATWDWAVVATSGASSSLDDLARAAFGSDAIASGRIPVYTAHQVADARFVAWSCHQPYVTEGNRAVLEEHADEILRWYADEVRRFRPHVVWGGGDSSYSDGTEATDFSNQVYDQGAWYENPEHRAWLRQEYRRMYRHFWSLEPMRRVMAEFPHLFIWDDHEIHDGWGSEGKDFEAGNVEMMKIAQEVAEEYILRAGPRVRSTGREAHQAYLMGPMAAFIFDTRSTRNYEASRDRLISRQQFEDFVQFLGSLRGRSQVRYLILNTSVPFVGLLEWVTSLATRAPDVLNDTVLAGIRDDVRDSWTSPGNIETFTAVLSALRTYMLQRPDTVVVNVSGDIHVANAFEIYVPGFLRPIYQLTSSAITNRTHPPGIVGTLIEIGDSAYIEGVGEVRRIWETVTDPNVLFGRVTSGRAEFTLKVWDPDSPGSKDLSLSV